MHCELWPIRRNRPDIKSQGNDAPEASDLPIHINNFINSPPAWLRVVFFAP